MEIEDLVLSIDNIKHLKELGLEVKDTALCWCRFKTDEYRYLWDLCRGKDKDKVDTMEYVSTMSFEEILNILPKEIILECTDNKKRILSLKIDNQMIWYEDVYSSPIVFKEDNLLMSVYRMLCWLLENGYFKK